jgi:hypothetical protein
MMYVRLQHLHKVRVHQIRQIQMSECPFLEREIRLCREPEGLQNPLQLGNPRDCQPAMREHPSHRQKSGPAVLASSREVFCQICAWLYLSDLEMRRPIFHIVAHRHVHSSVFGQYPKDFSPCYFEGAHLQGLLNLADV